jgi:hypothetical protein
MQWVEEEVVEEVKEGAGVDPAKFAASLKSDDDAASESSTVKSSSRASSDSLESDSSDSSTAGEESEPETSEKVGFVLLVGLLLMKPLFPYACYCCCLHCCKLEATVGQLCRLLHHCPLHHAWPAT